MDSETRCSRLRGSHEATEAVNRVQIRQDPLETYEDTWNIRSRTTVV